MARPPNAAIVELASAIGDDAAREIVRIFLDDFPASVANLAKGDHEEQVRISHGLKSSALHMGAAALSARMAEVERRLSLGGGALSPADIAAAAADFEAVAPSLRLYAGG